MTATHVSILIMIFEWTIKFSLFIMDGQIIGIALHDLVSKCWIPDDNVLYSQPISSMLGDKVIALTPKGRASVWRMIVMLLTITVTWAHYSIMYYITSWYTPHRAHDAVMGTIRSAPGIIVSEVRGWVV